MVFPVSTFSSEAGSSVEAQHLSSYKEAGFGLRDGFWIGFRLVLDGF